MIFSYHLNLIYGCMEGGGLTISGKVQTTNGSFSTMLSDSFKVKILLEYHESNQEFQGIILFLFFTGDLKF